MPKDEALQLIEKTHAVMRYYMSAQMGHTPEQAAETAERVTFSVCGTIEVLVDGEWTAIDSLITDADSFSQMVAIAKTAIEVASDVRIINHDQG